MRALPLLLVLGCTPDAGPPTCDGGGATTLELGDGGRNAFVPFSGGDTIPTRGEPAGLDLDLWTSGIDTSQPVTAVVRASVDGGPTEDSLASLTLTCADSGNGWTNVLATLGAGAAPGSTVSIESTVTDWTGVTASTSIEGVLP